MRLGLILPAFRDDPGPALDLARSAEQSGLDGVFVMDHVWPIASPGRPALAAFPLLGAVAAATSRLAVGPLVARVGWVADSVLVQQFETLVAVAGAGRVMAGLGAGDRLSHAEHEASGVPVAPASVRLSSVTSVAARLIEAGTEVWIGGRSPAVRAAVRATGATLNVWAASAAELAEEGADVAPRPVTWAGQVALHDDPAELARRVATRGDAATLVAGSPEEVAARLASLAAAGATWCVVAPVVTPDVELAAMLGRLRRALR